VATDDIRTKKLMDQLLELFGTIAELTYKYTVINAEL
jgi:hypothetical protein